jgi:hypothetical protein
VVKLWRLVKYALTRPIHFTVQKKKEKTGMFLCKVKEPFIGTKEENAKYANAQGVIPWAIHHPISGRKLRDNYVELSPERAKTLEEKGVVQRLTKAEVDAIKKGGSLKGAVNKPAPVPEAPEAEVVNK